VSGRPLAERAGHQKEPKNALTDRAWALGRVAVLAVAAVLFFGRLGDRGVVSEELRWAEVAREMRLTGDYFHPTINGQTYYDKPLGSYWLIAAASLLTGTVDEATARLPAAAAGWLGVLLVLSLAARLYDRRTALASAAVLTTCFGFVLYARRATADVETVTGVLAAVALYERCRHWPNRVWVIGLWLVMAATSLTKGLLGFALPCVALAAHATWAARANRVGDQSPNLFRDMVRGNGWLGNPWTLLAAPLAAAVYLAPFLISQWQTGAADGLDMVFRENVRRFVAPHNHTGPVYLYAGFVFVLAAPWSAFLPAALWPRPTNTDGDRLARAFFWAVFLFFTASASRRSYYLLPILPSAALLVGRVLTTPAAELKSTARRLRVAGYFVIGLGTLAAGAALLPLDRILPAPYDRLPPLPDRELFAFGWGVSLAGLATAAVLNRGWGLVSAGIAALAVGYTFLVALPAADEYRSRKSFAAEVRDLTGEDPDLLALFHARDVAFDLGRAAPIPNYDSADELAVAIRAGRVRWVVARTRYLANVDLPATAVLSEPRFPWEGIEQIGDKMVLLRAMSK
jgi:4-amino-4-deoxy-L-arabinose transferase-like glycosyltransferase